MADITKCVGTDCPQKESCYRYTAPNSTIWQSYFCESPIKEGQCEMFWGEESQSIYSQLQDIVQDKQ